MPRLEKPTLGMRRGELNVPAGNVRGDACTRGVGTIESAPSRHSRGRRGVTRKMADVEEAQFLRIIDSS